MFLNAIHQTQETTSPIGSSKPKWGSLQLRDGIVFIIISISSSMHDVKDLNLVTVDVINESISNSMLVSNCCILYITEALDSVKCREYRQTPMQLCSLDHLKCSELHCLFKKRIPLCKSIVVLEARTLTRTISTYTKKHHKILPMYCLHILQKFA